MIPGCRAGSPTKHVFRTGPGAGAYCSARTALSSVPNSSPHRAAQNLFGARTRRARRKKSQDSAPLGNGDTSSDRPWFDDPSRRGDESWDPQHRLSVERARLSSLERETAVSHESLLRRSATQSPGQGSGTSRRHQVHQAPAASSVPARRFGRMLRVATIAEYGAT